jgi:hypothetical protein
LNMMPSVRGKRFSSGFTVQLDLPYLVLLNEDPLSSDIKIYNIKEGDTIVGNDENRCEIVVNDSNLYESHCLLKNYDGIVTLSQIEDSVCILNNIQINKPTKLSQGDLIILGSSVFRFNHPQEAAKLREIKQACLIF